MSDRKTFGTLKRRVLTNVAMNDDVPWGGLCHLSLMQMGLLMRVDVGSARRSVYKARITDAGAQVLAAMVKAADEHDRAPVWKPVTCKASMAEANEQGRKRGSR